MSSVAIGILAILGFLLAILYIAAPLMLYGIYTRLGEISALLRAQAAPRVSDPAPPPDMFRTLG